MKKLTDFKMLIAVVIAVTIQSCTIYNPYSENQLPVPDIVQMSKDGMSSLDIIRQIRQTHSFYSLKADQLADLREQGVQDSVINYMQKTHIDAIRHDQRIADSYYGWPGYYGYDGFGYGIGFGWPYSYGFWGPGIIIRSYGGFHGSGHSGHGNGRGK